VHAPLGAQLHEPRGHLTATRVVDADEQHLGHLLGHRGGQISTVINAWMMPLMKALAD
jgi:hypothetical protein